MKAVFDSKPNSGYDDQVTLKYHFPKQYLGIAEQSVGDWVIYREPQRNSGRRAYVASAQVDSISPDPEIGGHYYARVSNYLPFAHPVPFNSGGRYHEESLRSIGDPKRIGASIQGRSIREISEADFAEIVLAGLGGVLDELNGSESDIRIDQSPVASQRRIVQVLVNRVVREANFRHQVCQAYDSTCAATGVRIIGPSGIAEVQAAHIWPVSKGGPDVVQNGLALSSTAHWLFDNHMISISPEWKLLVSPRVPKELARLFEPQRYGLILPKNRSCWPDPSYLQLHRITCAANLGDEGTASSNWIR